MGLLGLKAKLVRLGPQGRLVLDLMAKMERLVLMGWQGNLDWQAHRGHRVKEEQSDFLVPLDQGVLLAFGTGKTCAPMLVPVA